MKIDKILITLLLIILTIGAVSASDGNSTSDDLTVSEDFQIESSIEPTEILSDDNEATFSELDELIKNTPEYGVLTLEKDYKSDSKNPITLSKAIKIDGNNHTLNANKASRIFNIKSTGVVLENIVFENGYSSTGGAISYQAKEEYGPCYCNISNCTFLNCQATDSGAIGFVRGYAFSDGGHGYEAGSSGCAIEDCTFINCSAFNNGGAFCFYDETYNGAIRNCNFINCYANNKGGAIDFYDYETDSSGYYHYYYYPSNGFVDNCSFSNCYAQYGGAIHVSSDSFFDPLGINRLFNSTVRNCNFRDCSAILGGAIYWNSTNGRITNSNFTSSSSRNGGAVYAYDGIDLAIADSSFEKNTADESGGAVYGAIVSNCTFKDNSDPQHYSTYSPQIITYKDITPGLEPISIRMHESLCGNFSVYISYENDNYTLVGTADIIKGSAEINYKYEKLGKYNIKAISQTNYGTFESYANTTVKCIIFDKYDTTIYGYYTDFEENRIYAYLPDDATGNFSVYVSTDGKNYELYECINISNYNKIINFKPENAGTYYLNAVYDGNYGFENASANITYVQLKDKSKIKASDATVFYNDNGKYSFEVSDFDGYIAYDTLASVKIADKAFKKSPTWEGVVTVNIPKLNPGTYKITISYNTKYRNLTETKKLTVKHIVTLKTVKVKKSAQKLTLQATLKNKKAIAGKTVTFKFNGKTYKAKTDKNGIAKVTIKSSVLKKLKVGKKITYQATYLKDTVKKTVKVQK